LLFAISFANILLGDGGQKNVMFIKHPQS